MKMRLLTAPNLVPAFLATAWVYAWAGPATTASNTSATRPATGVAAATQRALIIAIAKWRSDDFAGAGSDLTRLINAASPDQRDALSVQTQTATGLSLAELAADTHLRAAFALQRGSAVRLSYVTEYEKPMLVPRLVATYKAALREGHTEPKPAEPGLLEPPSRGSRETGGRASTQPWYAAYPAQSQPASAPAAASAEFAAIDWLDRPEQFQGTPEQAAALASRVHHALSLVNELMRIDPGARYGGMTRRALVDGRSRLIRLSRVLEKWSDREELAKIDPQQEARDRERREQLQRQLESRRTDDEKRMKEILEQARKWKADQEQKDSAKSRGLFGWLLPKEEKIPAPADSKK